VIYFTNDCCKQTAANSATDCKYEHELVRSVRRCPSLLSVWMVNRILNTDLPNDRRQSYVALLDEAVVHSGAPETVREDARHFLELQMRKRTPTG
jgi:hypothetical protein